MDCVLSFFKCISRTIVGYYIYYNFSCDVCVCVFMSSFLQHRSTLKGALLGMARVVFLSWHLQKVRLCKTGGSSYHLELQ